MIKRIYPVKEAAEQLGISRTRLFELIKLGAIESTIVGRRRVVTATALDRFAAEIDAQAAAETDARARVDPAAAIKSKIVARREAADARRLASR